MKSEWDHRRDIVEVCKRIHAKGWISSTDGNVSIKLGGNRYLVTPTGIHKGFMDERDLIVVDGSGRLVTGSRQPTSEITLHLTCYQARPDVRSVVHAHPTMSVAFSLAGIKLAKCLLPEVVFTLGSIPTAEYAPPTTAQVAESITRYIMDYDAIILERHGSLTVGGDVFCAYNTLERMEHVAEITYHARQLGNIKPLSQEQIDQLQKLGEAKGWPKRKVEQESCNNCNACSKLSRSCGGGAAEGKEETEQAETLPDNLAEIIAEEVAAAMGARR